MGDAADALFDDLYRSFGDVGPVGRHRRLALIKTCNRCGQKNLRWQNVKGGAWRLHTPGGELHVCRPAIERVRSA